MVAENRLALRLHSLDLSKQGENLEEAALRFEPKTGGDRKLDRDRVEA